MSNIERDTSFKRVLFEGVQIGVLVAPMQEPLNIFPSPDRDIKGLPPRVYEGYEKKQMESLYKELTTTYGDKK